MNFVRTFALAAGFSVCAVSASAVYEVNCRVLNSPAMLHEAVKVEVKITNRSGQTLSVEPGGKTRLRFVVERKPGYPLDPRTEDLLYEPFEVRPGETKSLEFNLKRFFDLVNTGPYTVRALLLHRGRYYSSARALLDVVPGFEVQSMSAAAPGGGARKYTLKTLTRDRGQALFIVIDDPARNLCYGVYELGPILAMHAPRMETDRDGRVHVLHQSGPSRFTHSVFSPDGRPLEHEYFTKGPSLPALRTGEDGAINVTGVIEYQGDAQASRPVIRPFNPFE